ncbi:N-acyl homoserine lactonase family protein [Aquisalinus flavus]|nr:N-acyl homoserine lactonase family protein [Aquisalinus flavus]UNE49338.1 N-acyl homoserine lactonase family protein [Aquisalinus flavus]
MACLLAASACSGDDDSATETTFPDTTETVTPDATGSALTAGDEDESATATSPAPTGIALYAMNCGTIAVSDLDIFAVSGDYAGMAGTLTDSCYLIRHPQGDLLWDLGLPAALLEAGPQTDGPFTVSLERSIADQLAELGLSPADIDYMSISHMHFDHTGQPEAAAGATWLVHEAEYDAMFAEETAGQYQGFTGFETAKFTGDYDVFGDGSVMILELPGHTPGHTALQVELADTGTVLLTGDLYHLNQSREERQVPRFNVDVEQTLASMDVFEGIAEDEQALVVIQHSPSDVADLPAFPTPLR